MKISFHHRRRQFFFVTLTLEGRPPVLSRLVDVKSSPELLPPGKTALSILRAIHKVYPCATLSDRVIMPDHIHFLLIVDYEQAPWFNPLWFSFVLVEAIELAWSIDEKPRGTAKTTKGRGRCPRAPALPKMQEVRDLRKRFWVRCWRVPVGVRVITRFFENWMRCPRGAGAEPPSIRHSWLPKAPSRHPPQNFASIVIPT